MEMSNLFLLYLNRISGHVTSQLDDYRKFFKAPMYLTFHNYISNTKKIIVNVSRNCSEV